MSPETLVIGAFGLIGVILSIAGLRLSAQLRRLRARLLAEIDAREQQSQKLAEADALRTRAAEARDMVEGLRREVANAKAEVTALREQVEYNKGELLRANAIASDAMQKRGELAAKIAELTAAAEAADHRLHDHADLVAGARSEASQARDRASQLEKQLLDAQKKLSAAQAEGTKLSRSSSKAEADARAAAEASSLEARTIRIELDRAKAKLGDTDKQQKALEAASNALRAELARVKAELAAEAQMRAEAEKRAAATAAAPAASAPAKGGGSGVIAALEADPGLNRGQRETIRMMYDKFTAKTGKG